MQGRTQLHQKKPGLSSDSLKQHRLGFWAGMNPTNHQACQSNDGDRTEISRLFHWPLLCRVVAAGGMTSEQVGVAVTRVAMRTDAVRGLVGRLIGWTRTVAHRVRLSVPSQVRIRLTRDPSHRAAGRVRQLENVARRRAETVDWLKGRGG